jgi:protein TonB
MFNVVVEQRKRRVWSARTVAVSIGAHLLVLAAVVVAAANGEAAPVRVDEFDIGRVPETAPPQPVKPTPPAPVDRPAPVQGRTLVLPTPTTVPPDLPPPSSDEPPANPEDYTGEGPVGNVIGTPPATPQPPAPIAEPPLRDWRTDDPIDARDAEQLPQLLSPRDAQRMLERVYPSMLRDAGVTGHTTVILVIDKNGVVEPGSVTVQESTHDAFRDAAVRAAERFRFRPARLHGQAVAVSLSIPIEWKIQP